jgi:hypothetical protein
VRCGHDEDGKRLAPVRSTAPPVGDLFSNAMNQEQGNIKC